MSAFSAKLKALVEQGIALQATVIPPAGGANWPLHLVIGVMCFLASVALGITLTVSSVADQWSADLAEVITVQVKPRPSIDPDEQMEQALAIIRETPGIASAEPISSASAAELLEPWLGGVSLPDDIGIPQLIDVRLQQGREPDLDAMSLRLRNAVPGIEVDDHFHWKSRLAAFAGGLEGLAIAALLLIIAATVAIVVFATRAAMEANKSIIEVLHLIGARDAFIASEFQAQFLWVGLRAGAMGAASAAILLMILTIMAGGRGEFFLPGLGVTWITYPFLVLVPILAAGVSLATARLTALSALGQIL